MKSSLPLVYIAQDKELVHDYRCMFGYPGLDPVMEDENDEDELNI